jgi:hypothetical protein
MQSVTAPAQRGLHLNVETRSFLRRVKMANNRKQVQPVVPAKVTPELVGDKAPILTLGLEEQIRARAYELYEQRGRQDGHHEDDWRQAEAEILARELKKTTPKAA